MTNATYAPQGALASLTNGGVIFGAFSYNTRLQPLQIFYGTNTPPALTSSTCPGTVGNIMHRVYNFGLGVNDNGNVDSIANCRDTNRTANFTYDSFNRIQTAYSSGPNWGESFGSTVAPGGIPATAGIDPWGNLWQRSPITGKTGSESLACGVPNTKNQLNTCYSYDAAGNLTQNGTTTYTYDAENRLTALSSPVWYYVYDGDGNRVEKCTSSNCPTTGTGTMYWRNLAGNPIAESGLNGTVNHEYIFFGGTRVARRDITGNSVHYYFSDHLGTHAMVENATGTQCEQDVDYYPYGGVVNDYCNTQVAQNYKFTGKERDAESSLDNFGARYFASSLGRFMTPDPQFMQIDRLVIPQRLNLYAYVSNNPLANTDPTGRDIVSGTGDQKAIRAALVDIASRPGGRAFLQKFDKLSAEIKMSTGSVKDQSGNPRPAGVTGSIKPVTDPSTGKVVDATGHVEVKLDPELGKAARANGMEDAPKSDAEAIGHELEHIDQKIHGAGESETGATGGIDDVLGNSPTKDLKKDAGQFVDDLLKPNQNNQNNQNQPPPPPPPKCSGDNKENCSN